ncbi:MAG: serine/threonine-protein phosphatase [Oligoflexia bacterium]|nr:serine/threonine-protein phosphatase [Oligoflexia bacterium]
MDDARVLPRTRHIYVTDHFGRVIVSGPNYKKSLYDLYCYNLKGLNHVCEDCPVGIIDNERNQEVPVLNTGDIIDLNLNKQGYIIQFNDSRETITPVLLNVGNSRIVSHVANAVERTVAVNSELERELELGGRLQSSLLPDKWQDPLIGLELVYRPLAKVSGDIFDIYRHGKKGSFFLIADVSGHGVASALITALLKSYIFQHLMTSEAMIDLTRFASYLNNELSNLVKSGDFITMFMGYIHTETLMLNYVCFGHPSPILIRNNAVSELDISNNVPLLMINDFEFSMSSFQLSHGDIIVLYTDGVTECKSPENELLGISGLKEIISSVLDGAKPPDNSRLADKIFRELSAYTGMAMYSDDITIAALTVNRQKDPSGDIEVEEKERDEKVDLEDLEKLF